MLNGLLQASLRLLPRQAYTRWFVRLLGIALFVILISQFDFVEVAHLGASIPLPAWLAAIGFNIALLLASAVRWHGMVNTLPHASTFTFSMALEQFLRYYAVGLATPARAAELTRAWGLSRLAGLRLGIAGAVVLLERGMDVAVSLALSFAALALLPGPWLRPLFWLGILGAIALLLTVVFAQGGIRWLFALLAGRLHQVWRTLGVEMTAMPATWRYFRGPALLRPILWTIITHACFLGLCIALALGLSIPAPPLALGLAALLASVIGSLPVTVAGLGTREAALILLLEPYGIPPETALAYSLALLVVVYGGGILPGAVLWLWPARSARAH
jgi:uncharacterized membrane protein YbhN (UPF0104 family)